MNLLKIAIPALLLALAAPNPASASIIWNWSFTSEAGQFVTDGTNAVPGTYTLVDFSVTASTTGGTIGSLSGGQYFVPLFSTDPPLSFVWDGTQVTQWLHSGGNTFDWWAFGDSTQAGYAYFFGWDTGNINDPTRGAHYNGLINDPLAVGTLSISPDGGAVPEPSAMILLGGGLAFLAFMRKRA